MRDPASDDTGAGAVMVRLVEAGDTDDVVDLLAQLGYDREADAVAQDVQTGEAGIVYVAVGGGRLVGLLAMSERRQFHWGARVAAIEALVVDGASRSRGVGAILLDTAIDRAHRDGCILVELHSNRRRRRAHQFYKRQGFEMTSGYFVRHLR